MTVETIDRAVPKAAEVWPKEVGRDKVIYTLVVGDYPKAITDLTFPLLRKYARKIGADFYVIDERKFPGWPVTYEKLQIHELAQEQDREWAIYIDADALVSPNLFDITEHLPKDCVLHNGNDMASNRWTYDKYFRRDGRNIGSCNWFTVASQLCFDLWKPLDDLTLEQALSRIHPQNFELSPFAIDPGTNRRVPKPIIDAEHLIDDYTLSRNIAKYGLHFKSLLSLCAELGQMGDAAGYLFHQYLIPTATKVQMLRTVIRNWNLDFDPDEYPLLQTRPRVDKAEQIAGWMTRPELEWLNEQARLHTEIAEIGSFMGRSTTVLAETSGYVWAIDTWEGSEEHRAMLRDKPRNYLYDQFTANLSDEIKAKKVIPTRGGSCVIADGFMRESFDMIFIDGAHGYDSVKADILAWIPLLSPDGLLCGHDFGNGTSRGLEAAVRELLPGFELIAGGSIWFISAEKIRKGLKR